jgi:peptidyl-prolyl cis-trans isomerase D
MRRHKSWLKWSLGLVCVTFVVFYIPDFLSGTGVVASGAVASIEGQEISEVEFRRIYQSQLQAYRGAYGSNVSEQLLKQLGIDQQILQQLVEERAAIAEADRLGITVTDDEVRQRILSMPAFQDNGQFVGTARYQQMLQYQRTPMSPAQFEEGLRQSLAVDKLRSALTDWMTVSDAEVEKEYRRRNEKVKLEIVNVPADSFRDKVTVADPDLSAHYDAHKEEYRIGERRKIKYVAVDVDAMRPKVAVPPRDVERYYNDNLEVYTTPEQVRASHILLKTDTDGKNDAEVKARAEKVLQEAKAGGDFAGLAKKYSEDEANAKQGGDLDYFSRGKMVPQFEDVAFAQAPGTLSDLVKTQYGYHIIKLVDKKPTTTRTLDQVRQQIIDQLSTERAQRQADLIAEEMGKEIRGPEDLDRVGKARGLQVTESGFFTRDEPILGLGASQEVSIETFAIKEGQVSQALRTGRGYAFLTLTGRQEPKVPKLEEVRDRVREDVIRQKTRELARQRAAAIAAQVKSAPDFQKAAKEAGVEAKATDLVARDSPLPDIGVSQAVDTVAFTLPAGGVSDAIATDTGAAIVKVVSRTDVTPAELAAGKATTRDELLNERRSRFFTAYMSKAKQRMKIEINQQALQRVIG